MPERKRKPRVFIGSSKEGHSVAEYIQLGLDHEAECTTWSQGVFGLSKTTSESLFHATRKFDYAVLVLTPDDLNLTRGKEQNVPRDNVVFELGLFMGALTTLAGFAEPQHRDRFGGRRVEVVRTRVLHTDQLHQQGRQGVCRNVEASAHR